MSAPYKIGDMMAKWKTSKIKKDDINKKLEERNKLIELKGKYEEETKKLIENARKIHDFTHVKLEASSRFDFTETSKKLDEIQIELQTPTKNVKMLCLLKIHSEVASHCRGGLNGVSDLKGHFSKLLTTGEKGFFGKALNIESDYGYLRQKVKFPETIEGFDNWFKKITKEQKNSYISYLEKETRNVNNIIGLKGNSWDNDILPFIKRLKDGSSFKEDLESMVSDFKSLEEVKKTLTAIEDMHEAYDAILTLVEDVELSEEKAEQKTKTMLEKFLGLFNSFGASKEEEKVDETTEQKEDTKAEEKKDSGWYEYVWGYANKKDKAPKADESNTKENTQSEEKSDSTEISTNVGGVEFNVGSEDSEKIVHQQYQAFTEAFLSYAKTHCFGKVANAQKVLANCHAYRLSTGTKDAECKAIEEQVKIFTDHCEYAFPFEMPIDDKISESLLNIVDLKGSEHEDGQLSFIGAGNEYKGHIIAQGDVDAEKILKDYVADNVVRISDGDTAENMLAAGNAERQQEQLQIAAEHVEL